MGGPGLIRILLMVLVVAAFVVGIVLLISKVIKTLAKQAAMAASGVLNAINEGNGAMGSFANAVYDAGGMNGELESVVVKVEDGFVLRLLCTTDGLTKSCKVVSAKD